MPSTERAVVTSTGLVSARAKVRQFELLFDKPPEKTGHDAGPMPSEVFLASMAACHLVGFTRIAAKRNVPVAHAEVDIAGTFDKDGDFDRITMTTRVTSNATREAVETVDKLAERACTVQHASRVPVERSLELRPA